MWRLPSRVPTQLNNAARRAVRSEIRPRCCQRCLVRFYSAPAQSSSGRGAGRVVLSLVSVSTLVTGGAIVYAKFDDDFRSRVESSVPFSNRLFDYFLGEREEKAPAKSASPNAGLPGTQSIKDKAIQSGLLQKKLEREASKKEIESTPASVPTFPVSSPPKEASPSKADKVPSVSQPQKSEEKSMLDANLQKRIVGQDVTTAAENTAVETIAKESMHDLRAALAVAMASYKGAVEAIQTHTQNLQKALDVPRGGDQDAAWAAVSSAALKKSTALTEAEKTGLQARESVNKLKIVIQEGRKSKLTASNSALVEAEEAASKAVYDLQLAESQVTLAQAEATILSEYKKLVEQGKEQFKKEIQSIIPDVKVGEKGKKLTEEELNYLIAHAHHKVEQLQKQLDLQQAGENLRVQKSLDIQRKEYEKLVGSKVGSELERQQRELQILYQKRLNGLNEDFEHELLQQLRRQAAAHSEHLRDVLQAQLKELQAGYDQLVEDRVGEARHEFQRELSGSLGRLKGIEQSLKSRSEMDLTLRRSRRLVLACKTLQQSVQAGHPEAKTWEEQRKPLVNEIAAISETAGPEDRFVHVVLKSIPEVALRQGVFAEDALKDRFFRVDTVCRRVAMVGDEGGSLVKFALSYLQSLFVLANHSLPEAEVADEPVDVDKLTTFDILDRARWHLDRNDLEQALRFMTLLRGAPKKVASDWLLQARAFLEVKQATSALLARAAATEAQAVQ